MMEEEPELDTVEQQAPSENYFPNEEVVMEMRPENPKDLDEPDVDESEYMMMDEEAERAILGEEELPAQIFEDQEMEERSYCAGVLLGGKCYQFFSKPKTASDAEFFCQDSFPDGHLASITSQQIHREVMNLILKQNGGYTRTWVGGLRFLNTNRFVWLDGSHWSYADWLSGEPNHTAGVEDCLEVLGNGKFNDFTCWEPQAFVCSYSA
ncbi:lectin [Odontesthes bonariensis]